MGSKGVALLIMKPLKHIGAGKIGAGCFGGEGGQGYQKTKVKLHGGGLLHKNYLVKSVIGLDLLEGRGGTMPKLFDTRTL
jgi:hypothetical protein